MRMLFYEVLIQVWWFYRFLMLRQMPGSLAPTARAFMHGPITIQAAFIPHAQLRPPQALPYFYAPLPAELVGTPGFLLYLPPLAPAPLVAISEPPYVVNEVMIPP